MNSAEAASILGVSLESSKQDVARAYRAKARASHPDRFVDVEGAERDRLVTEFRTVREARDVLIDRLAGADFTDLNFAAFVARRDVEAWTTAAQEPAPTQNDRDAL